MTKTPPEITKVIKELLALGLCPVPVIPKQKNRGLKLFQGKQPSYFDAEGTPRLLAHKQLGLYDRIPTEEEREQWFSHPDIGIGSFGSSDGLTCWIDFDAKHFDSERECRKAVSEWRLKNGIADSWVDKSGGGGYRVLVKFEEKPNFTRFALTPDGKTVGEILGYGKFCVLAPSFHPNGKHYEREKSGNFGVLTTAEKSGLYPVTEIKEAPKVTSYNPRFKPLTTKESWTASDWARSYLQALNSSRADDYDTWLRVGIALRSVEDPHLLDDWILWSKQSSKFEPGVCEKKWGSFKKGEIGLGTLAYLAKQDGWVNPLKSEPKANNNDEEDWAFEMWLKYRKYTPDISTTEPFFKFGDIPEKDAIIAGKGGLGQGKTTEMTRQASSSGRGSKTVGYINSLLHQIVSRFNNAGIKAYHLHSDDGFEWLEDCTNAHVFFCLPSIKHSSPSQYEGVDLFIDETCLVLASAMEGTTLKEDWGYCLEMLKLAIDACDRVFLLDGNLRDIDCNLIKQFAPKKRLIKYENVWKSDKHTIHFVEGVKADGEVSKRDKSVLIRAMLNKDTTPWIVTDSLELSKLLHSILEEISPGGRLLNSETSSQEWAIEFLANPTEYIAKHRIPHFIASPTASSGLDVHGNGHFTHKFTLFTGVLGTNAQTQMMFRLRDNLPHYVVCPEKGIQDCSSPKTYSVKQFQKQQDDHIYQSMMLAANDNEVVKQKLEETLKRSDDAFWEYSAKLGVIDRYEKDNLRKCLVYALENSGHKVEFLSWEVDKEINDKQKEIKEAQKIQYARELWNSKEIPFDEAKQKARSNSNSTEVQREIEKAFLANRLMGIKGSPVWTQEFIENCYVRNPEFIPRIERFYLLNNLEISRQKHEVDWYFKYQSEYYYKGQSKKSYHSVIWALNKLQIQKFFNLDGRWHKNSAEILEIVKQGYEADIALALGFMPEKPRGDGKERMEYVKKLTELVGVKLRAKGKVTIDNARIMSYSVDAEAWNDINRIESLKAVERRFKDWFLSEKSQVQWFSDDEKKMSAGSYLYTGGGGADTSIYEVQSQSQQAYKGIVSPISRETKVTCIKDGLVEVYADTVAIEQEAPAQALGSVTEVILTEEVVIPFNATHPENLIGGKVYYWSPGRKIWIPGGLIKNIKKNADSIVTYATSVSADSEIDSSEIVEGKYQVRFA